MSKELEIRDLDPMQELDPYCSYEVSIKGGEVILNDKIDNAVAPTKEIAETFVRLYNKALTQSEVGEVDKPKRTRGPFASYEEQALTPAPDVDLIEILADIEHERWSGWMLYFYENNTPENNERWRKQMVTAYGALPEHSKESDRKEARITLAAISKHRAPDVDKKG